MPARSPFVLAAAGVLAASTAGSPAAITDRVDAARQAGDAVVIEAEFVPFELRDAPGTYLGPIDLQQLFHPGGSGSGTPCTVDSTKIEQNEIRLDLDLATGGVTGSGGLVASCQFNVGAGCEAEQRVVQLEFAGVLDRASGVVAGNVSFRSLESQTQSWGTPGGVTGAQQAPSCEFGTYPLPGVGPYETPWLLDLCGNPPSGYLATDLLTGDPLQRFGVFEVTNRTSPNDAATVCPEAAGTADDQAAGAAPPGDPQVTVALAEGTDGSAVTDEQPSSNTSNRTKALAALGMMALIVVVMVVTILLVRRWRGVQHAAAAATMGLLGDDAAIRD